VNDDVKLPALRPSTKAQEIALYNGKEGGGDYNHQLWLQKDGNEAMTMPIQEIIVRPDEDEAN
jgi:hypothetical protein